MCFQPSIRGQPSAHHLIFSKEEGVGSLVLQPLVTFPNALAQCTSTLPHLLSDQPLFVEKLTKHRHRNMHFNS